MFHLSGPRRGTTCDGATRRDFLKAGVLGLGGLLLPDLLRLRAADRALGKATNAQALEMNFKGIFLDEGRRILG